MLRKPAILVGALLLGLVSANLVRAAEPEWILEDEPAAIAKAQAEDKLVLVDIWADWCGWCKKLDQDVFPTEEFAAAAESFVLLKIDNDANEGYLEKTGQNGLPTTAFLLPDGRLLGARAGYMPVENYVAMLEEAKGLRALVDADVSAMSVEEALEVAGIWTSWANTEQATRIYENLKQRPGLTAEQRDSINLSLVSAAIGGGDFDTANGILGPMLGGVKVSRYDTSAPGSFVRVLYGIAMGWHVPNGTLLALDLPTGERGALFWPTDPASQAELLKMGKELQNAPYPNSLGADRAAEIGRSFCKLLLTGYAKPYLTIAGASGAGDLVGVLLVDGDPAAAVAQADKALAGELPDPARQAALAGKVAALAAQGEIDAAKAVRDELLSLEGLDPTQKMLWANFFSDDWLPRYAPAE